MLNYQTMFYTEAQPSAQFAWGIDQAQATANEQALAAIFPGDTITTTRYWIVLNKQNVFGLVQLTGSGPLGPINGMLRLPGTDPNPKHRGPTKWNTLNPNFVNNQIDSATHTGAKPQTRPGKATLKIDIITFLAFIINNYVAAGDLPRANAVRQLVLDLNSGKISSDDALKKLALIQGPQAAKVKF